MTVHRTAPPMIGPRHALGHVEIDADHFAIADYWRQAMDCSPIAVPFYIARLRKRMRAHFSHEVQLVEAAGAQFCSSHRLEHEAMLRLCDDALSLAESNWRRARALLRTDLMRMLRDHINCTDQIAVLVINEASAERESQPAPR